MSHTEVFSGYDSINDQDKRLHAVLKNISLESVNSLANTRGFGVLSLKRLTESVGSINAIFIVRVQRLASTDRGASAVDDEGEQALEEDWILRVVNPWKMWTRHMQGNEAFILNRIGEWNRLTLADGRPDDMADHTPTRGSQQGHNCIIPVATVLSYSNDASTSPLGCEYSLVTKMPGSNAEDVMDTFDISKRKAMWKDWFNIIREMGAISPEFMFRGAATDPSECAMYIGTFGYMERDGVVGPFLRDGFPLQPAKHLWQQEREALQLVVSNVPLCKALHKALPAEDVKEYLNRTVAFLNRLESGELRYEELWPPYQQPYRLSHNDLNMANILVDEATGHITAILDWDRAHWGLHHDCARESGVWLLGHLFAEGDADHATTPPTPETHVKKALFDEYEREFLAAYPACNGSDETRIKWAQIVDSLTLVVCMCATWLQQYTVDENGEVVERGDDLDKCIQMHWERCKGKLNLCGL